MVFVLVIVVRRLRVLFSSTAVDVVAVRSLMLALDAEGCSVAVVAWSAPLASDVSVGATTVSDPSLHCAFTVFVTTTVRVVVRVVVAAASSPCPGDSVDAAKKLLLSALTAKHIFPAGLIALQSGASTGQHSAFGNRALQSVDSAS